ncbi:hypothetical protein [Halopenitus persicus]|uniref:RNA polymerase subunit sigma-70 n=1 Tax=Halopenitus persicus TaxID=1048396 RepID=A0A1H3J173_9EURY|nr:hypothetical protein [Halopenitus persicus]QHS17329.1 RNA polymerase subunit sigma-70 [haloarchaeon 3A1-DGR]SDY33335.1 hypothetical protein SAMN05216564_104333 [Halopenitus persicus]
MYELLDETAAQVILATEPGDTIQRVADRLHRPYETVRGAVDRLEDGGFLTYDDGLSVVDDRVREATRELLAASATSSPPSIEDAYRLPTFGEWPFAFTRIDAVYVWTRGGYQIGRDPDDYPLFLAVRDRDLADWERFFDAVGVPTAFDRQPRSAIDGPLQVVLDARDTLEREWVDGYPVQPRSETITYMRSNYAQFQPALEMLDRLEPDIDLNVTYREGDRA